MSDQTSSDTLALQKKCLQEITSLLVSAGYYKAGDLGDGMEFDVVVGGLAWLITSTLSHDLDCSLPTLLNASSISTRISLSETLHKTLQRMEMPLEISPHQIQGVDAPILLPVVKWAVKNFLAKRALDGKKILGGGGGVEFKKVFAAAADEVEGLESLEDKFRVTKRKYKFKGNESISEEQAVHKVLLEYGEKMRSYRGLKGEGGEDKAEEKETPRFGGKKASAFDKQLADAQKLAEQEDAALDEAREALAAKLMKNVEELNDEGVAGRGGVGGLVTMGADEIGAASAEYERKREAMLKERASRDQQKEEFNRRKEGLSKEIESARRLLSGGKQAEGEAAKAELDRMLGELQASKDKQAMIESELQKLLDQEQSVPDDQKAALKKLWALVQRNEKMKRAEKDFKEDCKKKLEALQLAIKNLNETEVNSEEEEARMKEIDEMFAKIEDKWTKVRQLLAQRNLQVAATSRKIDDVPTRTEMIQYERRFVELYQQVGLKLEETRRYYAMYNTLDKTREFLGKEVKLIDSITNSFEEAMKTKGSQEEFAAQFEAIVKGVESFLSKQKSTLDKKQDDVARKEAEYMEVVDGQRRYFKTVKLFQEECQRNEMLMEKAEELGLEVA
jgi:chromosome segregation ATPase